MYIFPCKLSLTLPYPAHIFLIPLHPALIPHCLQALVVMGASTYGARSYFVLTTGKAAYGPAVVQV